MAILVGFSLFTLVAPAIRIFCRVQVNGNEWWNAYHAQTAAQHFPLYGTKYSWTTVNYPLGSFYVIGRYALQRGPLANIFESAP